MRPIDLAREHGLSAQAIRNYDEAGILPPTERTASGYRRYTPLHAQALRTFLTLRRGHGHQHATAIMRAINTGDTEAAYRRVDATHADLLTERDTRGQVAKALAALADPPEIQGPPLTVGELARRLDLHPATLRAWESEGILRPERERGTGYRHYSPAGVRDAEIARQLRRGGYPLHRITEFLDALREAGGTAELSVFLTAWQHRLTTRSRDLLAGAACLDTYLSLLEQAGQPIPMPL
ncbi:MerR family transcriptional regulator [Nocardia sp. 2]|uniref:MerR family transcriptional regulator n=1 Tax=Nocardia acididurans TaxID=2802282 RepID=A0ABS1M213_9NOCA|nr:MerR family transcriptional regulator [Nocardia acididurans]MBL1074260.1 MerR family transcriptional regulator [Nocardia acididurans]